MFALFALPWLAFCAWHDLRTRTIPPLLTIPPLVAAIAWQGYSESWPVAVLAALLLILDGLPWQVAGFVVGMQGLLLATAWSTGGVMSALLGLALIGIWVLWKFGAIGGADAQVVMTLALFFGPAIQKLRDKHTIPAMLGILAGAGLYILK
jgi:Flp pilus assembly protein protease CpaA